MTFGRISRARLLKIGAAGVLATNLRLNSPSVTITSPAAGSTVSGTVPVTATYSGPGFRLANLSVDGTQVASVSTQPIAFSLDTSKYPEGSHTLGVRVEYRKANQYHWTEASLQLGIRGLPIQQAPSSVYPSWVYPGISLFNQNGRYAGFGNKEKWTTVFSQQGDAHLINTQETPANSAYNVKAGPYFTLVGVPSAGEDWGMTKAKADTLASTFSSTDGQTHDSLMRVSYPGGTLIQENGFPGVYIADPLNTNVQSWMASNILSILQTNPNYLGEYWPYLNACFFDDWNADYRKLANAPGDLTFTCPLYPSLASWQTGYRELARVVIANLQQHGYYCVGNDHVTSSNDTTDTLAWWDFNVYASNGAWRPGLSILDGHYGELWIYTPSGNVRRKGTANFYDYWDSWVQQPENAAARGSDFHGAYTGQGGTAAVEQAAARYTRATFLMSWDGNSLSTFSVEPANASTDPFSLANLADGKIGLPTETRHEVNTAGVSTVGTGFWVRHFSNGWAICNTTTADTTVTGYGTVPNGDAIIHIGP